MSSRASYLVYYIVRRVNFSKLSRTVRKFVRALRTTTTNCRVSFINVYLVFPKNFRVVFLSHASTVILLEPYCDKIPVVLPRLTVLGADHLTLEGGGGGA